MHTFETIIAVILTCFSSIKWQHLILHINRSCFKAQWTQNITPGEERVLRYAIHLKFKKKILFVNLFKNKIGQQQLRHPPKQNFQNFK